MEIILFVTTVATAAGLAVGSFMNAVEYRWARGESVAWKQTRGGTEAPQTKAGSAARSRCPHCQHELTWLELIPVVSFIVQGGKCRACSKYISWQYPAVELAAAMIAAVPFALASWCALASGSMPSLFLRVGECIVPSFSAAGVYTLYGWVLLFVFLYDAKHQLILDRVTLPAISLAAVLSTVVLGHSAASLAWGAGIGGGVFGVQYAISRGTWVGGGDIRLGVLMGAMLGLQATVVALFVAYILGAGVAVYLLATGKAKTHTQVAFGTFLSIATLFSLYYGTTIALWYLGLLGL